MSLLCNYCGWSGEPEDLVALTGDEDNRGFSFCPFCEENDFDEEEGENDRESD